VIDTFYAQKINIKFICGADERKSCFCRKYPKYVLGFCPFLAKFSTPVRGFFGHHPVGVASTRYSKLRAQLGLTKGNYTIVEYMLLY
jgi:hypothetical protein